MNDSDIVFAVMGYVKDEYYFLIDDEENLGIVCFLDKKKGKDYEIELKLSSLIILKLNCVEITYGDIKKLVKEPRNYVSLLHGYFNNEVIGLELKDEAKKYYEMS